MNGLGSNILWTLIDRAGRLGIAFVTGIIVARLLAPEMYGALSFSNALVGIVSFLNMAAIEAIVVRTLVQEPEAKDEILGSAFLLRLAGGAMTLLSVAAIACMLDGQTVEVRMIAPIIAGATLFNAMEVGECWLRQCLASKYGVIARQIALFAGAAGRICAAGTPSPLLPLALIILLESALIAAGLSFSYRRLHAPPWQWQVTGKRCRQLWSSALPLLLASAAVGIYVRIGVLILGYWQGNHDVGLLSIATIMAEATHAIPTAVMGSVAPILLARRQQFGDSAFADDFHRWLRCLTWLGLAICLSLYLSAGLFIPLLLGSGYNGSIPIFEILVWSAFFVFVSVTSEVWLISHNMQHYQLPKTLLAATVSIALNIGLAPGMGARGTAIATLIAYSVSAFWANALFSGTRPLFLLQLRAVIPATAWPLKRKTR